MLSAKQQQQQQQQQQISTILFNFDPLYLFYTFEEKLPPSYNSIPSG